MGNSNGGQNTEPSSVVSTSSTDANNNASDSVDESDLTSRSCACENLLSQSNTSENCPNLTSKSDGRRTSFNDDVECLCLSLASNNVPNSKLPVRFRPTDKQYDVVIQPTMTVKDVLVDVCRQANMLCADSCYLFFDSRELELSEMISMVIPQTTLFNVLPEVRLKYIESLHNNLHIGTQMSLVSPEKVSYDELLDFSSDLTRENHLLSSLEPLVRQITHMKFGAHLSTENVQNEVFIPLPDFNQDVLKSLPTISIRVPLSPTEFDHHEFLQCLSSDLEINLTDFVVVDVQEGSTKFVIKFLSKPSRDMEKMRKVCKKIKLMVLSKSDQFVHQKLISSQTAKIERIQVEIENFEKETSEQDQSVLSPDDIDLVLRLNERPVLINEADWKFLIRRSRSFRGAMLHSIQNCRWEFVLDHVCLIWNEVIGRNYAESSKEDDNEKILFHGTATSNFDGIFEENFRIGQAIKPTDCGWYGKGIYFSDSPQKASYYTKTKSKIVYLICCLVRLGRVLLVADKTYEGKPMHPNYDTHYVPVAIEGEPCADEIAVFREYVIKQREQIVPLYIVGLRRVHRFVLWRDAKLENEANSNIFAEMKGRFHFNVYGTYTSEEGLAMLRRKLIADDETNCVVVTNGGDNGDNFVRQCRLLRSTMPIVVYCMKKDYHRQWASTIEGPVILVTSNSEEILNFIDEKLK